MSFDIDDLKSDFWDDFNKEIKPTVESNLEHFIDRYLESHMKDQPYSVECEYCHKSLDVTKRMVDLSYDVSIRVEPCDCQKGE